MLIIIVAFHIFFVVSLVLLIQALMERKKKRKELLASKTQETKSAALSAVPMEPVNEQKKAVQLVHTGLENVLRHLTSIEGHSPEMALSEISETAGTTIDNA